jgi:hypothetical protein
MSGRGSYIPADWRTPENVDRVLVGLCAVIWLILLGMSVAAVVALVDLGRGFHKLTRNPHTGLLYIVIGVSALIVLAAIPVLLRARRTTPVRPALRPPGFPPPERGAPPDQPGRRAQGTGFDDRGTPRRGAAGLMFVPGGNEVDRLWLRGTTGLVSVMGAALIAVAAATYLMATGKDGAAWAGYVLAGFFAATMPVVLWLHLRQLRGLPAAGGRAV